jgi:hypothetical protein
MGTRHLYWILTGPSFAVDLRFVLTSLSLLFCTLTAADLLWFRSGLGRAIVDLNMSFCVQYCVLSVRVLDHCTTFGKGLVIWALCSISLIGVGDV